MVVSFAAVFFWMSRNTPPKETAAHIRTTFLFIVWQITAFVPFSRTLSRQIRSLRRPTEIIFYLPITWWECHESTMPTMATIATLEEAFLFQCLLTSSRFNTAGLNAYWKLAMRKIVNKKDDIFVNVPFVNLSKICLAWIIEARKFQSWCQNDQTKKSRIDLRIGPRTI